MAGRIAFVYPSLTNELYESALLYSPLALAYMGAYTPDDWKKDMYDEYVDNWIDPSELKADLVAMSAFTPNMRRAYYLADKFRERGIKTVCGGAHVSALPDEALEHFDSVVIGEGEPVWPQLIQDFEQGKLKPVYDGGVSVPIHDIKLPDRDLVHPAYHYPSFITSKGCPFACDYCYLSIFEKKKYRVLPVDAIIEDMDRAAARGIDFASVVVDENVSGYSKSDYENRIELFERMIKKKYKFVWGAQSTVDIYKKPELLKLMHKAGCRTLFLGLEATNNKNLGEEVNKGFAGRIDYNKAVKTIHKAGISVIGSFIIGLDNQDMDYAKQLPKALKKMNIEYPRMFFLTAWPGTPLYRKLEQNDRIIPGWDHVRKDIPNIKYNNFSHEEIRKAKKIFFDNYFTKPYILKIVLRWLFREPGMVKFFIKILTQNFGEEGKIKNAELKEKAKEIKKLVDKHFEGTKKAFVEKKEVPV